MTEQQTFRRQESFSAELEQPKNLHYVSRRSFAKAAFIGMAFLQGEAVRTSLDFIADTEREIWPSTEPSLTFLNEVDHISAEEVGIFLPGFGDERGMSEATDWQKSQALSADIPVGYVDYSTQGAGIDTITDLVRDKVDIKQLKAIHLFGSSMGGLYAVNIAAKLGVPVRSLVLCSSPSTFDNAYFGNLSNIVAKVPANRTFATLTKLFASAYRSHEIHPEYDLSEVSEDAFRRTVTGGDPVSLQRELQVARSVNIHDEGMIDQLRKVFLPDFSQVAYAASMYPSTDTVVQVAASGSDFKWLFNDKLGVDFKLFGVDYRGHANVGKTVLATAPWTKTTPPGGISLL